VTTAIVVSSTVPYSGKSGVCIALIEELEKRGRSVGYFKPYGTMPYVSDGFETDQDAAYVNRLLVTPGPPDAICPVVRTRSFMEDVLAGRVGDMSDRVRQAYVRCSEGRDVVVVEGPSDISQGTAVGLSLCEVAGLVDGKVLLVERWSALSLPDALLNARDCLGERLVGVVFNLVRESERPSLSDHAVPYLERAGVRCFGSLPADPVLSSVTVAEIVAALGGSVLTAEEHLDASVESFMVGAMGQEKALRFFRRKSHKAVITGGDRADVQLAALETSTNAIIVTGNLPPASLVLARADEIGVPVIMVDMDTLTAVERMEALMGRVRLHGPGKADRIRAMFAEGVRTDELLEAFGV
jgi:BioD-like phosphotransacetylase family protein